MLGKKLKMNDVRKTCEKRTHYEVCVVKELTQQMKYNFSLSKCENDIVCGHD